MFWEGYWCLAELNKSFQVPGIQHALSCWLERGGSQWEMAWGLNGGVQTVTPEVQSFLAVLSCKPSNRANAEGFAAAAAACSIQWSAAPALVQGNVITAVGSPFGAISPPHFANSIVHGIISNCWSPEPASDVRTSPYLLMADMRCLPGMEGGAALDGQGKTVAMMMIPLFSRAFNAEVPLLMPIEHIRAGWAQCCEADHNLPARLDPATPARLAANAVAKNTTQRQLSSGHKLAWASKLCSIVLISASNGSGWASGIVLSKGGLILTNAHVVQPRWSSYPQHSSPDHVADSQLPLLQVRVSSSNSSSKGSWHTAEIVYVFRHALDLALLRLQAPAASLSLRPAVLYSGELQSGQAVNVVGHALFSPQRQMQPSVTAGNITKVVNSRAGSGRSAALVMTSATVHAGASGGAVMAGDGSVVGITTSNAKHSGSGSTIPNLNFAVAADALRPLWALAKEPGFLTREALQRVDVEDPALAALFRLSTPPEQQTPLHKQNSSDRVQKKGSERLADLLSRKGLREHPELSQSNGNLTNGKAQISKL